MRILCKPLIAGQSILCKIKNDYSASFATVITLNTANQVEENTKQLADGSAFPMGYNFQMRFEFTSASGVAPSLLSARVVYDTIETS